MDKVDLCRALSFKGNIVGCTNTSFLKNLGDDIVFNLGIENIKKCKSIIVEYTVNPNTSIFPISDVMEAFSNLTNKNCETVFETQTDEELDEEVIQYKILLTGIVN